MNDALQSPTEMKKDTTLLAINLLGMYEIIAGSPWTLDYWYQHIYGATALLRLRGLEQFDTCEGGRLFMLITNNLIMACVGRRTPIPHHIHSLAVEANPICERSTMAVFPAQPPLHGSSHKPFVKQHDPLAERSKDCDRASVQSRRRYGGTD
jgi:hypothetical protein